MQCIKETQAIITEKPCVIRKTLLYYKQKCLVFPQKHQALLNIVSTFGKEKSNISVIPTYGSPIQSGA